MAFAANEEPWQSSSTFALMRQAMTAAPAEGGFAADEVAPRVWVGNVAAARDREGMVARGIRGVINLTEFEPNHFEGAGPGAIGGEEGALGGGHAALEYLAVRVADAGGSDILAHFEEVCDFVDKVLGMGTGGGGFESYDHAGGGERKGGGAVGPAGYCSPRHPTHPEPSFLYLSGTL